MSKEHLIPHLVSLSKDIFLPTFMISDSKIFLVLPQEGTGVLYRTNPPNI